MKPSIRTSPDFSSWMMAGMMPAVFSNSSCMALLGLTSYPLPTAAQTGMPVLLVLEGTQKQKTRWACCASG